MKTLPLLALTLLFSACQAGTPPKNDPFGLVFDVLTSETIFSTSFQKVMIQLAGICKASTRTDVEMLKRGNVDCVKESGIRKLSITPTATPAVSIIQASVLGMDKCAQMTTTLTARYGKPRKASANCQLEWKLKTAKGAPQRLVGIEGDPGDNVIYFSVETEQGP